MGRERETRQEQRFKAAPPPTRAELRREFLIGLFCFAATLGAARVFGWSTGDFVWSMWISSLLVGYAIIVIGAFRSTMHDEKLPRIGRVALAIFLIAFFTLHFGGFHFGHSMFLVKYFKTPLIEKLGLGTDVFDADEPLKTFGAAIVALIIAYWPMILAAGFGARRQIPRPGQKFSPGTPYAGVVRMHFLILFFGGLQAAQKDGFTFYAAALGLYFFPWGALRLFLFPQPQPQPQPPASS
jgi:hypothetical protein